MTFAVENIYIISIDGKPLYFCNNFEEAQSFCKKLLDPKLKAESRLNPYNKYYIEMYDNIVSLCYRYDFYFFSYNTCKTKIQIDMVKKIQDSSS